VWVRVLHFASLEDFGEGDVYSHANVGAHVTKLFVRYFHVLFHLKDSMRVEADGYR
jgi:hypothetical protein